MLNTYHFKKYMMPFDDVEFIYIIFKNGSYITLSKTEIISYDFKLYDELVWDHYDFAKKACTGQIKLKIHNYPRHNYDSNIVPAKKDYSRKKYFEELCLEGNNIHSIRFFNEDNFNETVCGNFSSVIENGIVTITAHEDPQKHSSDGENFIIKLFEPKIDDINWIHIDMENCESFYVYQSEIKEMKLEFSKELEGGDGFDFNRKLIGGYIKIKFKDSYDPRQGTIFSIDEEEEDKYEYGDSAPTTASRILKRFRTYFEDGEHDICHLYVTYNNQGYGKDLEECIDIDDIRDIDWDSLTEEEENELPYFIGGHYKIIGDDTLIIYFK